jgi:hypothetical protein
MAVPIKPIVKVVKDSNWPPSNLLQPISTLDALPYRERRDDYGRVCLPTESSSASKEDHADQPSRSATAAVIPKSDGPKLDSRHVNAVVKQTVAHLLQQTKFVPQVDTTKAVVAKAGDETAGKPSTLSDEEPPATVQKIPRESALETFKHPWSHRPEITISAVIGQVLHRASASTTPKWEETPNEFKNTSFLRTAPNISKILTLLPELFQSKPGSDILSFRLFQDPWSSNDTFLLPEIRMDFKVNPVSETLRTAVLDRMYAIVDPRSTYVMLPTRSVDVCLDRQMIVLMDLEAIERNEVLRTYVEKTKQNIEGDGRLRAPHTLRLPISSWMATKTKKKGPASQKQPEVIMGNYFFAGIEHRQTLSFAPTAFSPFPLSYNSVEAGQMGGRYGELSLQAPQTFQTTEDARKTATLLVKKAFGLVDSIDTAVCGKDYVGNTKKDVPVANEKGKKKKKLKTQTKKRVEKNGNGDKAPEEDRESERESEKKVEQQEKAD